MEQLIGRRLADLTTGGALDSTPHTAPAAPQPRTLAAAPLTPEQVAARQRAERARRQTRKKR